MQDPREQLRESSCPEYASPSGPEDRPVVDTQHPAVTCRELCPGDTCCSTAVATRLSKVFQIRACEAVWPWDHSHFPSLRQQAAPCKQSLHRNTVAIQLPKTTTRSRNWLLNIRKENFSHQLNSSSIQDFIKVQKVQKHTLCCSIQDGLSPLHGLPKIH